MDYLDTLKHLHSRPDNGATFEAGSQITWQRGDLMTETGVVDFIHVDDTGTCWAFVTVGAIWAAINLKFAREVGI